MAYKIREYNVSLQGLLSEQRLVSFYERLTVYRKHADGLSGNTRLG